MAVIVQRQSYYSFSAQKFIEVAIWHKIYVSNSASIVSLNNFLTRHTDNQESDVEQLYLNVLPLNTENEIKTFNHELSDKANLCN